MKTKIRKQSVIFSTSVWNVCMRQLNFCTALHIYLQMTPKTLQVSILGLQINFSEWANLQIMKSGNNEDGLYHMLPSKMILKCVCVCDDCMEFLFNSGK